MKIDLTCPSCGATRFTYPFRFTGTSLIRCANCGRHVGTVAELQIKLMKELERRSARQ